MDSLFKPPPFGRPVGAPRPSTLSATAQPDIMPLWDLFRNIGASQPSARSGHWRHCMFLGVVTIVAPRVSADLRFMLCADMEKQHRVLIRWEQHVAEQRAGSGAGTSASSPALRALKVVPPPSSSSLQPRPMY